MNIRSTRRMRLLTTVSALGLAGGVIAMAATPAGAGTHHGRLTPAHSSVSARKNPLAHVPAPRTGAATSFQVLNYNSAMCLDSPGGDSNAAAVQWPCNGDRDQTWHWGSQNSSFPGWFQLVNGHNKCLGVQGGSLSQGARAFGWKCLGSSHPDQYWAPLNASCSGYVPLDNLNSNYVLGVNGNSTKQDAPVSQYHYQDVCNNQFWAGV